MKTFSFKRLISENSQILLLSLFIPIEIMYFITQHMQLSYHEVHLPADDLIPFLPVFIIPYVIWYLYVPLPMLYMCFKDKKEFKKQCLSLFSGMILCTIVFMLYPTSVYGIRPKTVEIKGLFTFLCNIIYSNDNPVNACPSLHCYEALLIHLTTFSPEFMRKRTGLRIASAVLMILICASTVFVKQHSLLDVIIGCALAVMSYLIVYKLIFKKRKNAAVMPQGN